jgi:hypothetical protein
MIEVSEMQFSNAVRGAKVPFPEFSQEYIYMRAFTKVEGLLLDLARWQPTVDAMLMGVHAPGTIFLMVDQKAVSKSVLHRRGGVHVDGYWDPSISDHGHRFTPPSPGRSAEEKLILASNVLGCVAYVGPFDGVPGAGGDCSNLDLSRTRRIDLEPGFAWMGDATTMLHESIPVSESCVRTVVRLNVSGTQ